MLLSLFDVMTTSVEDGGGWVGGKLNRRSKIEANEGNIRHLLKLFVVVLGSSVAHTQIGREEGRGEGGGGQRMNGYRVLLSEEEEFSTSGKGAPSPPPPRATGCCSLLLLPSFFRTPSRQQPA